MIFHPTDFSQASHAAFQHALRIAIASASELGILHVDQEEGKSSRHDFPKVRETLNAWEIAEAPVHVSKVISHDADPVDAALSYLKSHPANLIVLATHQHDSRVRWLFSNVAEPIASGSGEPTLFLPHNGQGFIDPEDGSIQLRNILIPIDTDPNPQCAVDSAARLASLLGCQDAEFTLVHIGASSETPKVQTPQHGNWQWHHLVLEDHEHDVVGTIKKLARDADSDLIVMATAGHHGFLDALRGSTTERVLRHAHCPLLAVPH